MGYPGEGFPATRGLPASAGSPASGGRPRAGGRHGHHNESVQLRQVRARCAVVLKLDADLHNDGCAPLLPDLHMGAAGVQRTGGHLPHDRRRESSRRAAEAEGLVFVDATGGMA